MAPAMARIVTLEDAQTLKGQLKHWAYNACDCIGTREVWDTLSPRLDPDTTRTYAFERALQAPAMTMSRRGILVDTDKRSAVIKELRKELTAKQKEINSLSHVADHWDGMEKETGTCKHSTRKDGKHKWEKGVEDTPARTCVDCGKSRFKPKAFNPGSSDNVMHLLYVLHAKPPMKNKQKRISADDDVLDRFAARWIQFAPFCHAIQDYRGINKQIGFLKARLSNDNRHQSSFNVGAAWTGRFSSSKYIGIYGGNLQNIAERNRSIYIADPGWELCYADFAKAESHVVSYLAGDEAYIRAHEGPDDTHTYVAKLCFPGLPWTGDPVKDREIAEGSNPDWDTAPGHDWRFQAKRIAHAVNIGQTAQGTAATVHIPLSVAQSMRSAHRAAFPFIHSYQNFVRASVREQEPQINPLGRRAKLFGRPWDDSTWRQALAFRQQSPVADLIDMAIWHIWYELEPHPVQLLAQVHDAILFQFPKGQYDAVKKVLTLMNIPIDITDYRGNTRTLTIGVDAKCGINWGKHHATKNPHGLKEVEL